ncbi:hypothetical protein BX616_000855 [Lobosporangium transversale]|nr:hypothetical protein BX616_000855 [Lobosporangium transversale]
MFAGTPLPEELDAEFHDFINLSGSDTSTTLATPITNTHPRTTDEDVVSMPSPLASPIDNNSHICSSFLPILSKSFLKTPSTYVTEQDFQDPSCDTSLFNLIPSQVEPLMQGSIFENQKHPSTSFGYLPDPQMTGLCSAPGFLYMQEQHQKQQGYLAENLGYPNQELWWLGSAALPFQQQQQYLQGGCHIQRHAQYPQQGLQSSMAGASPGLQSIVSTELLQQNYVQQTHVDYRTPSFSYMSSPPFGLLPQHFNINPLHGLSDHMQAEHEEGPAMLQLTPSPESSHLEHSRKRTRKALSLYTKLEIIQAWESSCAIPELVKRFKAARTTIIGVIAKREAILEEAKKQNCVPRMMQTSRIVEARFFVLEKLLSGWIYHLNERCIPISNNRIVGQALELLRMLSGFLAAPLPPCLFTYSWLKGYKKRHNIPQGKMIEQASVSSEETKFAQISVRWKLNTYDEEDIYTCDVVSMFTGMLPLSLVQKEYRQEPIQRVDASSFSVLICSNFTGSKKREPLILVRQGPMLSTNNNKNGASSARVRPDDLTESTFKKWLTDFDMELSRDVVLLIDETMWRFFRMSQTMPLLPLRFIKLVPVPRPLSALLPMSAKIAKDFKAYYHTFLIEAFLANDKARNQTSHSIHSNNGSGPDHSKNRSPKNEPEAIHEAWNQIQKKTIQSCSRDFLASLEPSQTEELPSSSTSPLSKIKASLVFKCNNAETKLIAALKSIEPKVPDSVLQYYRTQDMYTGPSTFLRSQILMMRKHPDFAGCFGDATFGDVAFQSKEPRGRHRMARYKDVELAMPLPLLLPPPPPSRRPNTFRLFSQPKDLKALPPSLSSQPEKADEVYMLRTLA